MAPYRRWLINGQLQKAANDSRVTVVDLISTTEEIMLPWNSNTFRWEIAGNQILSQHFGCNWALYWFLGMSSLLRWHFLFENNCSIIGVYSAYLWHKKYPVKILNFRVLTLFWNVGWTKRMWHFALPTSSSLNENRRTIGHASAWTNVKHKAQ